MYIGIWVCICVYIYMYVCIYVCVYIYSLIILLSRNKLQHPKCKSPNTHNAHCGIQNKGLQITTWPTARQGSPRCIISPFPILLSVFSVCVSYFVSLMFGCALSQSSHIAENETWIWNHYHRGTLGILLQEFWFKQFFVPACAVLSHHPSCLIVSHCLCLVLICTRAW